MYNYFFIAMCLRVINEVTKESRTSIIPGFFSYLLYLYTFLTPGSGIYVEKRGTGHSFQEIIQEWTIPSVITKCDIWDKSGFPIKSLMWKYQERKTKGVYVKRGETRTQSEKIGHCLSDSSLSKVITSQLFSPAVICKI